MKRGSLLIIILITINTPSWASLLSKDDTPKTSLKTIPNDELAPILNLLSGEDLSRLWGTGDAEMQLRLASNVHSFRISRPYVPKKNLTVDSFFLLIS